VTDLDALLGATRVMVILRDLGPSATVARAEEAWAAGVRLVEVTVGTAEALDSLRVTVAAGRARGLPVAAGTVLTVDAARAAAVAGAVCTVAPGFDPEVLAASRAAGVPHLPGVATPSEVHRAVRAGCAWLKAFPAVSLGPAWFTAIRGPYPDVRFVATGGITPATAPDYLAAGARVVGLGSAGGDPAALGSLL
jgi:2-dehydro-3-deoxyphosphogluconate aldolase/(4S)-4-hydroxy-2-oxoglutarate aldolase